nr:BtrH N-terminal domain-containing protein [Micromonospora sp. DSM 115978]
MTERRSFKQLVRQRMARTGESYSTASRLVGDRRPAGVVAGYPGFGGGRHHESTLTRHLLAQAGMTLTEPVVCGLAGGVGFLYAIFEYRDQPAPLLTLVAQHHPQPWTPAVLDRLTVPYTERHGNATGAALARLRRTLDAGRPALVTVDRFALPWHPGGSPVAAADGYPVVVVGMDGDTVAVDDGALRTVPAERFAAAWAGHRKGRHHLLVLGDPPPAIDLAAAVRDAVRTTVDHLTGPVLGNYFDVNFGFSGMAKLVAELREPRTKAGWARRFGEPVPFGYAMARLDDCVEREYTAPAATRPLYADFLTEAAELLAGVGPAAPADSGPTPQALSEAAGLFRDSGTNWSELARRARVAGAGGWPGPNGFRVLLDELATLVEGCLTAERRAADLLGRPGATV